MATDSNDYLIFAENMRRLRTERGLTQAQLAKRCGMEQPHISDIEGGKREPGWTTARRIAAALDVTMDELGHPIPAASA